MRVCVCVCGSMLLLSPAFAKANDDERNDGANDEESHERHDAVQVPPPSRALVPRLVHNVGLVSEFGLRSAELALAAFFVLEHFELGSCWKGKECANHPGWGMGVSMAPYVELGGKNLPNGKMNPTMNRTICAFLLPVIPVSADQLTLGGSQTLYRLALRSVRRWGDQMLDVLRRSDRKAP